MKRTIYGIMGAILGIGSLLPLGYAYESLKDVKACGDPVWLNLTGAAVMGTLAFSGLCLSFRFLRFAICGVEKQSARWANVLLLGIGAFFPGFIFSLPITMVLAAHRWPDDDLKGLWLSTGAGVVAMVASTVYQLRRRDAAVR